jgi:hypothetical protein
MPKTPDRAPGPSDEEGIYFEVGSISPVDNGEVRYVDGQGFRFFEEGVEVGLAGQGISESQHRALDTLIHDVAEDSYEELTYSGNKVTNITIWTDAGKTLRVREEQITYSGNKISQVVMIQYTAAGTIAEQITETLTYSGNQITSITRTRNV